MHASEFSSYFVKKNVCKIVLSVKIRFIDVVAHARKCKRVYRVHRCDVCACEMHVHMRDRVHAKREKLPCLNEQYYLTDIVALTYIYAHV